MMSNQPYSQVRFDPIAFLELAEEIAAAKIDEAHYRAAIGRAYYALFLLYREKMHAYSRANSHQAVREAMQKHPELRAAASQLSSLHEMRKAADYDLVPDSKYKNWESNWKRSQEISKWLLLRLR